VRIGFPLMEGLWLTNSYTLTNSEISDVQDTASFIIQKSQGTWWTSMVGTSLVYDQRNNAKNPTSGYYLQAGADFAGVGGNTDYVRETGEARFYYPLTEKITLVGRAVGGHIEGWGGDDVRLLDEFFRGGETIRGFYTAGFGPRDLLTNQPVGGQTYWATTSEVRFPLGLPDELGMSGAAFMDAGSLFGASAIARKYNTQCGKPVIVDPVTDAVINPGICLADSDSIRASAGVSLIWNSPLGPLRLDIAKPFIQQKYDVDQLVRFGASTRF
jgi:outer membrane protein insertion porin family